jgi:two-component system cell cycle response regulator
MTEQNRPILVVDDNRLNRLMLARNLEQQGHTVGLAENGRQALDQLRAQSYDLVLLDIVMPEMDGYQVLEQMKSDGLLRDVPVVVISAVDEMESVVRCIEMGAEDYLPKPFDPILLRARINAGLEKKRLRDQEVEYLRNVALLTDAAAAVETEAFDPDTLTLEEVAARTDELGQLARVFQHMAREVYAREQRLRQQVRNLRIELDEAKKERQVAEITETEYFRQLQSRVRELRKPSGRAEE